jgi:hypothetical protein
VVRLWGLWDDTDTGLAPCLHSRLQSHKPKTVLKEGGTQAYQVCTAAFQGTILGSFSSNAVNRMSFPNFNSRQPPTSVGLAWLAG